MNTFFIAPPMFHLNVYPEIPFFAFLAIILRKDFKHVTKDLVLPNMVN